jgi:hypothetical protein
MCPVILFRPTQTIDSHHEPAPFTQKRVGALSPHVHSTGRLPFFQKRPYRLNVQFDIPMQSIS